MKLGALPGEVGAAAVAVATGGKLGDTGCAFHWPVVVSMTMRERPFGGTGGVRAC